MKRSGGVVKARPRYLLVVDVGGTHVKVLATGHRRERMVDSGPTMTAAMMVRAVLALAADWKWEAVAMGYPAPVVHGRPLREPYNLAAGWVGFDYARAFGRPVRIVNDAAMQAIGSYEGGRMLFLGLGTGLGSAMIVNGILEPMEIAHLPYRKATYEDYVGIRGLERLGHKRWQHFVLKIARELQVALEADYVVLGGGNVKRIKKALPRGLRRGDNRNAFRGGFRLWQQDFVT